MKKIRKITLNKEEQQTLRNYYKMAEEFSEFVNLEIEDSIDWLDELVLEYGMLDYNPNRKYAGVEFEMQDLKDEND